MKPASNFIYDAIVVGGGHNGLTAAAYLARGGLSTLVLERREIVGGCCVTEEIAPGCRVSTTSYIASMLRPEVISELGLADHGLRMIPCDPAIQVPFPDGHVVPWWVDRERAKVEFGKISTKDAARFVEVDDQLKKLARYLQPFFMEPPPEVDTTTLGGWGDLFRTGKRFRGISNAEIAQLISFLTGSLGEFLDHNYESEKMKTMFLANNVYGKHGGPYQPGTAIGLLFHLLSGGEHELQGFYGHVMGGMGSITQALAAAGKKLGVEIRTSASVAQIEVRNGRAYSVVMEDGNEVRGRMILSNADPKRTFLKMVAERELPEEFLFAVRGIKMDGPCAKVNFVLAEEPRFTGTSLQATPLERTFYTLVPSLEFAERCYDIAKFGEIPEELWVDCVVSSNADPSLAPAGKHILTCFVQYVPYKLREGNWDEKRELLGDRVVKKIAEYAPNVPGAIVARQVLTPLDLERTYGLTEGNIFHGDLRLEQLFFMRPVPGWAQYRTPIRGLYLCGAGAHPGGGVTGAPGRNAAQQALRDWKKRTIQGGGSVSSGVNTSSLPRTADIVILGAGVMGASIAFHLAQRGAGKVVVIDKDHVASGGSGRSSALVRMHYSFPQEVELALISLRMFQNWQEIVGAAGDFRRTGFVRIVAPNEMARLRLNVEMQRKLGVVVELIGRQELQELEPDWVVDDVELAAYEPDAGYGDGAGVAGDFLSRAREMGVTYLSRMEATSIAVSDGRVRGVVTDRGEISAPVVISATGPWTRPLFQQAGYDLPIECELHQVAILITPPDMKGGGCACIDSGTATYFRSDGQDKFLVGDFYGKRGVDPDNFPQRAADESLEEIIERACRRIPKLASAEAMRGVTGVYDMTPDSRPLLGEIPGIDGLYVCAGFSGMGFKISPAIGLVMSELVLDGRSKAVDIGAFRPQRFAEGQPIKAEYEYVDD